MAASVKMRANISGRSPPLVASHPRCTLSVVGFQLPAGGRRGEITAIGLERAPLLPEPPGTRGVSPTTWHGGRFKSHLFVSLLSAPHASWGAGQPHKQLCVYNTGDVSV